MKFNITVNVNIIECKSAEEHIRLCDLDWFSEPVKEGALILELRDDPEPCTPCKVGDHWNCDTCPCTDCFHHPDSPPTCIECGVELDYDVHGPVAFCSEWCQEAHLGVVHCIYCGQPIEQDWSDLGFDACRACHYDDPPF